MITQQRKKMPWSQRMPPTPPPGKKRRSYWPWIVLAGIAVIGIAFVAIKASTNAQHSSTTVRAQPTDQAQGMEQYTLQLAQNGGATGNLVKSLFDPKTNHLIVTEIVGTQSDHSSAMATIQHDCFVIQGAIWKSNIQFALVEVHILAPLVNLQGSTSTGPLGLCALKDTTERNFNWSSMTPSEAWNDYDTIWVLPALNQPG